MAPIIDLFTTFGTAFLHLIFAALMVVAALWSRQPFVCMLSSAATLFVGISWIIMFRDTIGLGIGIIISTFGAYLIYKAAMQLIGEGD